LTFFVDRKRKKISEPKYTTASTCKNGQASFGIGGDRNDVVGQKNQDPKKAYE
jgi:hypothetical protein